LSAYRTKRRGRPAPGPRQRLSSSVSPNDFWSPNTPELGFNSAWEELFPTLFPTRRYPPNTLLVVDRLVQEDFLIEIETIAAL
jgi:enamine deaminase RidA (YjgF/YER057c/UK114 family)